MLHWKPQPTIISLPACFNLLRWATLTPDLGVDASVPSWGHCCIAARGLLVWSDKIAICTLGSGSGTRYYMEVRKRKPGIWARCSKAGQFNYKLFLKQANKGDLMAGGITAGYQCI